MKLKHVYFICSMKLNKTHKKNVSINDISELIFENKIH